MKRLLIITILVGLGCLVLARPASAHVLQTDNNIGAILHINPADAPVTNQPASFILYFSDTNGKLTLPKCSCSLSLSEGGKQIYAQSLDATSATTSQNPYTFLTADVYNLTVTGTPKTPGAFQPFTLTYLVRVESGLGGNAGKGISFSLLSGLLLLQGWVLLAIYHWVYNVRRKR